MAQAGVQEHAAVRSDLNQEMERRLAVVARQRKGTLFSESAEMSHDF